MNNEEVRLAAQPPAGPANARAFAWSLVVHAIALGLLFVGLKWTHSEREVSVKGPIIEASLVIDPAAVQAPAPKPRPTPPKPKPKPEPPKPEPPEPEPPEPEPVPVEPEPEPTPPPSDDRADQEFIDEMGLLEEAEIKREQEERRRREQIELEQEERRERRERRELERQEQIADLERDRREEEDARMEDLLAQEQSQSQPRPGNEGENDDLLAQYAMALQQAITQEWTRPDTVPLGQKCTITILQIPGGEVVGAEVDPSCPFDTLGRRSIEAAVMKATPLPYNGFEEVFERQLNLTFTARDRY